MHSLIQVVFWCVLYFGCSRGITTCIRMLCKSICYSKSVITYSHHGAWNSKETLRCGHLVSNDLDQCVLPDLLQFCVEWTQDYNSHANFEENLPTWPWTIVQTIKNTVQTIKKHSLDYILTGFGDVVVGRFSDAILCGPHQRLDTWMLWWLIKSSFDYFLQFFDYFYRFLTTFGVVFWLLLYVF